uniref:Uncharacterized protein n=1 Tax=Phytophthora ramorum TaxID=164328 RepID=H3HCN1_PHYRM
MNRPTATRREIAPLHVPWMQHEQFPVTKQACSTDAGLVSTGKHSLVKVVQELKRGRANVDKQLAQLDSQLLAITDFLDGKTSSMFPPHLVMHFATGAAAVAGKFNGIIKSESEPPTPAMVEDDLNSDTPCTTTGLWKYLYAYSFFKTTTPEDMEQALLLEDPNAFSEDAESSDEGKGKVLAGLDFERRQDNFSLSKSAPQDLDDFFKESSQDTSQPDDEDTHTSGSTENQETTHTSSLIHSVELESWRPEGLTRVLRDVGLVEGSDKEVIKLSLSNPRDDEVSQEIRTLQHQLRACVEQTNESKRKLRKIMDETKPWLSKKKEEDDATIKKYFTMWQTKKELARKKKLREKKLQRRQALRLGGGGGNGRPLADDIDVKQR